MEDEEKTHVLLVGMGGILGDLVREIVARQSDMEIVGEVPEMSELRTTEQSARFGVVIVRSDDAPSSEAEIRDLLGRHSRLRVVTVQDDGRHGSLYRLRGEKVVIGELSPDSLVEAIRARTTSRASSA